MSGVLSRIFVIGVLLFYTGLIIAYVLWKMGRRLRSSGKRSAPRGALQRSDARRIFSRPFDVR